MRRRMRSPPRGEPPKAHGKLTGRPSGPAPLACLIVAALTAVVGFSGCGPSDPLDLTVDSTTAISLNIWKSNVMGRLSSQQLADFNEAVQQIKFGIMGQGVAKGAPEIEQAALEAINGRTVRSVLEMGFDLELQRLEDEKAERLRSMQSNARMKTRPDDGDSQLYLARLHDRQAALLDEGALQIVRVKGRLAAAGLPENPPPGSGQSVDTASAPVTEDAPPVLIHH